MSPTPAYYIDVWPIHRRQLQFIEAGQSEPGTTPNKQTCNNNLKMVLLHMSRTCITAVSPERVRKY
jgi:hypothetical protein